MAPSAAPRLTGDMLKHGQELYHQEKYQGALQCFSDVISQNSSSRFTALDNRASTYMKLGDLKAALRDGRRIIKEEKTSSMGYLRTGKILRLLGDDESALRIYIYGIGNVPSEDLNTNLLQNEYNKLVKLAKARDPLKILPLELVTMIFKFISFPNMVQMLRVSKSWCLLLSSSMNWSHLDFSKTDMQVPTPAIRQYVQRSRGTVTQASIHFSKKHHWNTLKYITLNCKALSRINILSGCPTTDLLGVVSYASLKILIVSVECVISPKCVSHLLRACKSLDRAEFHSCDPKDLAAWGKESFKIHSLTINACRTSRKSGSILHVLPSLLEKIPDVQHLSLRHWDWLGGLPLFDFDFSYLHSLRSLDMAHSDYFCFPLLPVSIETLDFSTCDFDGTLEQLSNAKLMANRLPKLIGLSVANLHHFRFTSLMSLLESSKGKLRTLNIKNCHNIYAEDLVALIQDDFLSMVTQLGLGYNHVGDEIVELLAANLQHVRILDLDSTNVTGIGIKALVLKENRTLERLNLRNCYYLSKDAVAYARSRGVYVDFSFTEPSRK